ncbi:MAG: TonB-dependent receptor family protein [Luteimonas sp.]
MDIPRAWLAALLLLPTMASAQAVGQTPTQLDAVVVTATRQGADVRVVPATIDVVGADEIQRAQPMLNVSEALQRVPGVVARDRHNDAQDVQISIRGFGARSTFGVRGVRLYSDGIPATMPDGQGQVSHFMLDSLQRIEVLRGPFSALYGNSSGGVIALFTADPPAHPVLTSGLVVGSDGLRRSSLSLHAPWRASQADGFLLDLVDAGNDGYREHSASRRRSGQVVFKGDAGGALYTIALNSLDLAADDPQGLELKELRGDRRAASRGALMFDTRKTVRQDQLGVHVEKDLSQHHALAITGYRGRRETTQMLSVPVFVQQRNPLHGGGAIGLDRDYSGVDARWRWSTTLWQRPLSLTSGVEYQVSSERRRGYENFIGDRLGVYGALRRDEDNRVSGRDAYVQADWQPTDRWRVNVGARRSTVHFNSRDHYIRSNNPDDSGQLDFSRTLPVAGVLFRVNDALSVYANAGGGFETPTGSELAYRNDGRSGLNTSLQAARSRNYEMGLRARRDELQYSAAIFDSRTERELVVVANQGGRSVYGNAGISRRRGIELSLSARISPHWHVATAYTFLDAVYRSDFSPCSTPPCTTDDVLIVAGRRIPGLSRHFAWGELRWSPNPGTDLLLQGRFVDRVFADDANSATAPSYASFDLGAERRFTLAGLQWRGFARINNIFHRDIIGSVIVNDGNGRYFEPSPGRGWNVGLEVGKTFE